MTSPSSGFFALWNGVPPQYADEFEEMHSRDHMLEHLRYLGPDEILWARRYVIETGTLPTYFTWYAMRSLDSLVAPSHAHCGPLETEWFKRIRPQYRDRIGHHCRLIASSGGGCGGSIATILANWSFDLSQRPESRSAAIANLVAEFTKRRAITGAHIGAVDWNVPPRVGREKPVPGPDDRNLCLIILESFSSWALGVETPNVVDQLKRDGMVSEVRAAAQYRLSYAARYEDLADIARFGG